MTNAKTPTAHRDDRVDAYIQKSAPFAQPILARLREIVHAACPDVVETMKWSMPFFESHRRPLCHMAAFKQHAAFGFWLGRLVTGDDAADEAMGQFGRLTALADLPPKKDLAALVKKAVALNAAGTKSPTRAVTKAARPQRETTVPEDLAAAFERNAAARKHFAAMPASHRHEYIEWIVEAKRERTRAKRLATTLEWLAEGKSRNWKYERK